MGSRAALLGRIALGVLVGGWIALGEVAVPLRLAYATIAATGCAAAGLALEAGRASGRRDLAVFAGSVVGIAGAALVSGLAVIVAIAAFAGVVIQATALERHHPSRDLLRGALAGVPLLFGALAVDRAAAGLVPWTLTAWAGLVRERAAGLGVEGAGSRSRAALVAALLALGFVPASLVLPVRAGYGGAYFFIAMFGQLALLVAAARLIAGRRDGVRPLLEGAFVITVLALLAGQIV